MSELQRPEFEEMEINPAEEPGYDHMLDHLIYIQQALREMELEGETAVAV